MADEKTITEVRRERLSAKLREILGSDKVYFQPPENVKMSYPCIRYKRGHDRTQYGDNIPYLNRHSYELVVISRDPTEPIAEMILQSFTYCRPGIPYVADNLNHFPFTVYW